MDRLNSEKLFFSFGEFSGLNKAKDFISIKFEKIISKHRRTSKNLGIHSRHGSKI